MICIAWSYCLGLLGMLDDHVCVRVCKMAGRVCMVCTCWCDLLQVVEWIELIITMCGMQAYCY